MLHALDRLVLAIIEKQVASVFRDAKNNNKKNKINMINIYV